MAQMHLGQCAMVGMQPTVGEVLDRVHVKW